jgi:hypothetical protein
MSIRAGLLSLALLLSFVEMAAAQGPKKANDAQQAGAAGAAGFLICAIAVGALIGIGIKIWIILFMVSDARKRGMDPTLYVILEIFVGIIGLIIYLCSREPLLSERRRYGRQYDGDEDDDDRPRRSRRYRDEDEDNRRDRRRDEDY